MHLIRIFIECYVTASIKKMFVNIVIIDSVILYSDGHHRGHRHSLNKANILTGIDIHIRHD